MPVGVGGKPASPPGGAAKPAAPAGKPAPPPAEPPAGAAPAKGGKKKLIIIILIVVLVLAIAAGGAFFAMKLLGGGEGEGSHGAAATNSAVEEPEAPGNIGKISISTGEPININLADGKYLAFSASIYFDETVEEAVKDASPARDVAFRLFNGMNVEQLSSNKAMEELQEKYLKMLNEENIEPYHGHVAAVKFTNWAHT